MMTGKCRNASSSHQVTCAMMSFTDQSPATPGSVSRELDKPAYDAWNAIQAVSSRFRSCSLFTAHNPSVNPEDARSLPASRHRESPFTAIMPRARSTSPITATLVAGAPDILPEEDARIFQRLLILLFRIMLFTTAAMQAVSMLGQLADVRFVGVGGRCGRQHRGFGEIGLDLGRHRRGCQ